MSVGEATPGAESHPIADPARRERAREYAQLQRRLLLVDLLLSAVGLLVLLLSGLSVSARQWLAAALPPTFDPLCVVAAYVALLVLAASVLLLPLSYYQGFVLPHRFELSVQSRGGWTADYVKGTALGLAEALALGLAVYALLRYTGGWWWLWAGLAVVLFTIVLAQLAPVLVLPLFYRLTPLLDDALRTRLVRLAEAAGTRISGVYVMDMSRRTRMVNAALMGLGRTRRIVLGDTLWRRFEPAEIEGVLAHELGHHVHGDIWRLIAVNAGLTLAGFWLADQGLRRLSAPLGLRSMADVAGLPLLLLVFGALSLLLLPATNGYSRSREAAADRFALDATNNAEAWRGALRKMADENLSEVDPPAWVEWLLYGHPSIRHRLQAAERRHSSP